MAAEATLAPTSLTAVGPSLRASLEAAVGDPARVKTRSIDRHAYASNASFYHLVPQAVVQPTTVDEVRAVLEVARKLDVPITFRAAGTSLSGQACTDGILLDCSQHWKLVEPVEGATRVRVGPGVIGSRVNQVLRDHHKRMGPDPASIDSCMMGGILANNASGMCCGVVENAYHTLHSVKVVLADGTVIDTAAPNADEVLETHEGGLARGLRDLRQRILDDSKLLERIRRKYKQKNTTGYSLNALVDFERPVDILAHLLIGSEGTLGFIAEATLQTLPTYPVKYTSLLLFDSPEAAVIATARLADSGARAVEFFDRASLRAVETFAPELLEGIELTDSAGALLVEYQYADAEELEQRIPAITKLAEDLGTLTVPEFTRDATKQARLWRSRKGLYPAVGAMRQPGTGVIIEDIAVPLPMLPRAVSGLQALFERHGYDDGIIFGHAKDGNLHFVITQAFDNDADIARYAALMDDLVELIAVELGGALKAEHGTGRNIAPFLTAEWGPEATRIMRELKALFDPQGILNPGVIINDDEQAHLKHLKSLPTVDPIVDQCVECGFCESVCPSRDLTLTPRQRIAVLRQIARLDPAHDMQEQLREALERDFVYAGIDTCAADGMCATACPVGINTGQLVKQLRGQLASAKEHQRASRAAANYAKVERRLRLGLRAGHLAQAVLGERLLAGLTRLLGRLRGRRVPTWHGMIPRPPKRSVLTEEPPDDIEAIVFPTCMSRIMGRPKGAERAQQEVLLGLAEAAGVPVWAPSEVAGHCCGLPMSSKGFSAAAGEMLDRTVSTLHLLSRRGELPIVVDASSCTYALRHADELVTKPKILSKWSDLRFVDAAELVQSTILPRLDIEPVDERVFVHPNCAARKLGIEGVLLDIATRCAAHAEIPKTLTCCATAGDRGLLFPELSRSALAAESAELANGSFDRCVSSNVTCEAGLSFHTGQPFSSYLYLVEAARTNAMG